MTWRTVIPIPGLILVVGCTHENPASPERGEFQVCEDTSPFGWDDSLPELDGCAFMARDWRYPVHEPLLFFAVPANFDGPVCQVDMSVVDAEQNGTLAALGIPGFEAWEDLGGTCVDLETGERLTLVRGRENYTYPEGWDPYHEGISTFAEWLVDASGSRVSLRVVSERVVVNCGGYGATTVVYLGEPFYSPFARHLECD